MITTRERAIAACLGKPIEIGTSPFFEGPELKKLLLSLENLYDQHRRYSHDYMEIKRNYDDLLCKYERLLSAYTLKVKKSPEDIITAHLKKVNKRK